MYSLRVDLSYKGVPTEYLNIEDIGPVKETQKTDGVIYEQQYRAWLNTAETDYCLRSEYFWCFDDASDLTILSTALIALDT